MGIKTNEFTKLFDFIYKEKLDNDLTEYEFDHVFVAISDSMPIPEPSEVCDYKYVDADLILKKIREKPDEYTVWFKKIIERVLTEVQFKVNKLTN